MPRVDSFERSPAPGRGAVTAAAAIAVAALAAVAWWRTSTAVELVAAAAGLAALALVVALLASRNALRRQLRSIRELADAARTVSPHVPGARFRLRGASDEIGWLVVELNRLLDRIEESVGAELHFAGNVAHEFRTPVSTLLAEVQLRKLGSPGEEEEREFLDRAEAELRHLGRLIESFLIMSRIEAGEQRRDPVHVDDVVRRARIRCLDAATRRAVRIEVRCPKTTPPHDPFVAGNAELLQVLVENLIRNAVQHSPEGACVSISTHRSERRVRIDVSDRGEGISDQMMQYVFQRGVRPPTAAAREGTGLGLSIASAVARLHDGAITLRHNEQGGCTFTVELPAMDIAESR